MRRNDFQEAPTTRTPLLNSPQGAYCTLQYHKLFLISLDNDEGGCFDRAGNGGNEGARGIMDRANPAKINQFGIIILLFYIIFHQL